MQRLASGGHGRAHRNPYSSAMPSVLYFAVLAVLVLWSLFWVVRLAVRYGMNDAVQMNRALLERPEEHRS